MKGDPRHGRCSVKKRLVANGFTLIEVLVALGIVAVTLATGMHAVAGLVANAERQTDMFLANICAENALVNVRLLHQLPEVGDHTTPCEQAQRIFSIRLVVEPTPNPNFRRVEAQISREATQILKLVTIARKD